MPVPDTPITKRLHISGLTPAISSDDLSRRLGTFGSVTSIDGQGKLDALGQPRKFVYVTLETTKTQLSRCMNVLSGSTWKGAKLRIGEAKPDFGERILLENAPQGAEETRPRKRRRLARGVHGRHAQDMSLVTCENVHQRGPHWRITALGRLIRPMRMRPARPLGLPLDRDTLKVQNLSKNKGKKRRARAALSSPPTRSRRRTIDPLRWGSVHLSGVFLDGEKVSLSPDPALVAGRARNSGSSGVGANGELTEVEGDEEVEEILDASQTRSPADDNLNSDMFPRGSAEEPAPPHSSSMASSSTPVSGDAANTDLAVETAKALQLLNTMFGEANEDWGGAESVDSEMEQEAAASTHANDAVPYASQNSSHDATDFEVVPAPQQADKNSSVVDLQAPIATAARDPDPVEPSRQLKDLFAPREEEGFSLINHLDLDSELDLDFDEPAPFANNAPAPALASIPPTSDRITTATRSGTNATAPKHMHQSKSLDVTLPFFFLQNSNSNSNSNSNLNSKGHGNNMRRRVMFARTDDEAQIRARWEAARGELTREWKRRHREAVKSRRRRGGGGRAE
ncbi:hypothetical protein BJV74DRAFT_799681 [Russula compacta]|nr:hypothetical protein BJV74DRAFT_799681 [Russula compacta]